VVTADAELAAREWIFAESGLKNAVERCCAGHFTFLEREMKAAVVRRFGPPEAIEIDELPRPEPKAGEVLVRVAAAGVGPWDALIREDKSVARMPFPITLGSDLSGTIESVGPGVTQFKRGDEVYGCTNSNFIGAYAEFAVASAGMLAPKPKSLNFLEAASAPVVAVTPLQMIFEYAHVRAGQTVLIHGAAGNVGTYAVQLAKDAGLRVIATGAAKDAGFMRGLGAEAFVDFRSQKFEEVAENVDAVLDMVGGDVLERSMRVLKPTGILVTVVSPVPKEMEEKYGARVVFFLVEVTTERLNRISAMFDAGKLKTDVGTVLPLAEARKAHEMLAGAPHARGKIVLQVATS
jgi:NADPH:quinone reductase-like Zn-dependent oxidoreductase